MDENKAYVFLCSNSTEDECFERMLFGGTKHYQSQAVVKRGDLLFLYNYKAQRMHGIFRASSDSEMNIVPNAWNGQYPWQVEVEWIKEYPFLTRVDFEDFISIKKGMPIAKLSQEQLAKLIERFKAEQRLPPQEKDYRDENPATIWTDDRHKVRSHAELTIDNWLFGHKIAHGYEGEIRVNKDEIFCDFFIPTTIANHYIFIEYWGREDERYIDRMKHKQEVYKRGNFQLFELFPSDLENLEIVLEGKLKAAGIQ